MNEFIVVGVRFNNDTVSINNYQYSGSAMDAVSNFRKDNPDYMILNLIKLN